MEDSRLQRLRSIMGEASFTEHTRQGISKKAEAEEEKERKEAEEEKKKKKRVAQAAQASATVTPTPYTGPVVKVEYATADEIRKMIHPRASDKHAIGELAPPDMEFCPIQALAKFPYKYMHALSDESDRVSKKYFANEKFWKRQWSLWYIYPPVSVSVTPLILVPALEAKLLLDSINNSLGLDLKLTGQGRQIGLLIDFPDDGTPRPKYLGISDSKAIFSSYEHSVPKMSETTTTTASDRSLEAWKRKIECALEATKRNKKRSKEKKQAQRIATKTDWARQLRRTQRYLGLRERNLSENKNAYKEAKTGEEQEAVSIARTLALEEATPTIDVNNVPAHPFDLDVVFVSVDVEVYERDHSQITEIGIARLDSKTLKGLAPGTDAANWIHKVKGRHFIVKEHAHLVNSKYVTGCPDRFEEQFGTSEEVSIDDAKGVIERCLQVTGEDNKPRPVILVGHDIESDVNYLRQLELDIKSISGILEILDTSNLYRSLMREEQPASLATLLYNFEITGWNLHNAGNDAGYTLQALLAIAVKSLSPVTDSTKLEEKVEMAKKEAEERVRGAEEEWDLAAASEDEDDGGGVEIGSTNGS